MWVLVLLVIVAVAAGLFWAFYNFEQLKKISIASHFTVDEELNEMSSGHTLGVV